MMTKYSFQEMLGGDVYVIETKSKDLKGQGQNLVDNAKEVVGQFALKCPLTLLKSLFNPRRNLSCRYDVEN
jgi:hypothetical protein